MPGHAQSVTAPAVEGYVPPCVPYAQQVEQVGELLQIMAWLTLEAPVPQVQPPMAAAGRSELRDAAASAWVALNVPDAAQSSQDWPRPILDGPLLWTVWQVAPAAPVADGLPLTQHPVAWHSQPVVFDPLVLQFA